MSAIPLIDIPFDQRHTCWFAANRAINTSNILPTHTPHPSLAVPACSECLRLAKQHTFELNLGLSYGRQRCTDAHLCKTPRDWD